MKKKETYQYLPEYTWGGALTGLSTGASLGASIGSIIPGLGNIIGGIAGAAIGAVGGAISSGNQADKEEAANKNATRELLNTNYYQDAASRNPMGLTSQLVPYGGQVRQAPVELEKQEQFMTPGGMTGGVNGPAHAEGGVPMSLPVGSEIFSDRFGPSKGTTFAKEAKKYIKKKENTSADKLDVKTADKMLNRLFTQQETMKQEKVAKYAKKMGLAPTGGKQFWAGGTVPPDGPIKRRSMLAAQNEELDNTELMARAKPGAYPVFDENWNVPDNYSPYTMQQKGIVPKSETDGWDFSGTGLYNEALALRQSKDPSFTAFPDNIDPMPTKGMTTGMDYQKATTDFVNQNKQPQAPKKSGMNFGDIAYNIGMMAPAIYNLTSSAPKADDVSQYMNRERMKPERMNADASLREAERSFSAMVNDPAIPWQQRNAAAKQLASLKSQTLQGVENDYKQQMLQATQFNAGINQQNIQTAMAVKDKNDADVGAYYNMKAQAATDISQIAQKSRLEKNMRDRNDMVKNSMKSAFANYEYNDKGELVYKNSKTPLTDAEVKALTQMLHSFSGQYNQPVPYGNDYYNYYASGAMQDPTAYWKTKKK